MRDDVEVTYRCVVGHVIAAGQLDALTETVSLDGGASVRVCRDHGAPIAMTVSRPDGSRVAETRA